jgi:7-cyano-7-deazaguanine synthase in queuosine biosynthesis
VRTAGALANALAVLAGGDASAAQAGLDRPLLAGRTADEIMDAVVEAVRPIDGTQDAEAERASMRDAMTDLLTVHPDADLLNLDPDQRSLVVERFAASDVFLTTDQWQLRFLPGGLRVPAPSGAKRPASDSVMLLSGGLDSLIGGIDLAAAGRRPFAVSQTVRGDAQKQNDFAAIIGGGLRHIQLNHNVQVPGASEDSQRGRSLVFIAFGVAVATALAAYARGETVPLFICENGFIAMNAPLTGIRLGSLSTRTAHPEYLGELQQVLDAAGLRVRLFNPYAAMTKGEMLIGCGDQPLLGRLASVSTSCGRFQRFNYRHCGRCVPCQVRRAAFLRWGHADATTYVYEPLGKDDAEHAQFDDVRAVALANAQVRSDGFDQWLGAALAAKRRAVASCRFTVGGRRPRYWMGFNDFLEPGRRFSIGFLELHASWSGPLPRDAGSALAPPCSQAPKAGPWLRPCRGTGC